MAKTLDIFILAFTHLTYNIEQQTSVTSERPGIDICTNHQYFLISKI